MNGRRAGARRERLRERARAPETRPYGLVLLSRSRHWDVRRIVAGRPDLPALGVGWSARCSVWSVRAAVARRPDLAPKTVRALASDIAPVRLALAANPGIDAGTANLLVDDHDPYVAGVAIGNPRLGAETIRAFTRDMHRPAWALRRAATNPVCPPDLRDELLTWLAIGGGGRADPLFDPVECSGDPGDGSKLPYQWYRDSIAGSGSPPQHPLWLARSAVSGLETVTLADPQVHDLAVDERRAVRVAAARFKYRKALAALAYDEDEIVRRQARLTLETTRAEHRTVARRITAYVAAGVVLLLLVLQLSANLDPPRVHSPRPLARSSTPPTTVAPTSSGPPLVFMPGDEGTELAAHSASVAVPGGFGVTATTPGRGAAVPARTVLRILATGPGAIVVDDIGAVVPGYGEVDGSAVSSFRVEPGTSRTVTVTGATPPAAFVLHLGPANRPGLAFVPVTGPDPFAEGTTT